MTPQEFVDEFGRTRVSAILRTNDQRKAAEAMDAAIRGGFTIVEFTLTIPGVYELIREFSQREGVRVGAGTVLDVDQARLRGRGRGRVLGLAGGRRGRDLRGGGAGRRGDAGHTHADRDAACASGRRAAVQAVPSAAGGPAWLRSVLGPLPFLKVVPTNGIDVDNMDEWFAAGAHAGGFVASLFAPADVAAGNWTAIEARARTIVERATKRR